MSVMAKWRNKTFEVSTKKVNPIKNFSTSTTIKSDDSKSKKESTELVSYTFDVDVYDGAGINPQSEYESWCYLIGNTSVLYMNGRRFGRETKLTGVDLSGVKHDDFGRIRFATIGLTFEEVNRKEIKSEVGARVSVTETKKAEKKTKKKKGKKVTITVGSSVKLTGNYYTNGKKILAKDKKRILKVSKIKGEKAFIAKVDAWVYTNAISLVS